MGSAFKSPKLTTQSNLSPEQQQLLDSLSTFAGSLIGAPNPELDALTNSLLSSTSSESRALSERVFKEALLGPAMDAFNTDVAPGIAGDFAAINGTLSSRRGQTLARERSRVVSNATGQLAGILPQIESFPLQQTLSQVQGLGEIQRQRFTPFQQALNFALTPTRTAGQSPAGPGWGLLGSAIQAGGFLAGGAIGG